MKILFLLNDNVDFDGRARRMINIARKFGKVVVVHKTERTTSSALSCRLAVPKAGWARKISAHLIFGWYSLQAAIRLKPDLIISANFFTIFWGALLKKYLGAKLVYDAYELLFDPENRPASFHNYAWFFIEKYSIRTADLVVAANYERMSLMKMKYKLKNYTYMLNIPDSDRDCEYPNRSGFLRDRLNSSDREKILIYQGAISRKRGIFRFVDAVQYLPKEYRLVFIGGGPDVSELCRLIEEKGLGQRIDYLGRVENKNLGRLTRDADVGLMSYSFHGINNLLCSPNKIFEYGQAGIPVLSSNQQPISSLIDKYKIGVTFTDNDDACVIAQKIEFLCSLNSSLLEQRFRRFNSEMTPSCEHERVRVSIGHLLDD